jgi:Ca2+/Na+ antiporter
MILKKIKIIFLFLISHVLSVYYIKKKHGSVKVQTEEGIVYLNADNFNKNNKIHILFDACESFVDKEIHYEFSDIIPNDDFIPSISKKPDAKYSSGIGYYKYYYDIKKNVSAKYLIIKYTGYDRVYWDYTSYLKIENILINWRLFRCGFFYCIIGLIILIVLIGLYIDISKKCKKKLLKSKWENIEQKENLIFYKSNNKENVNDTNVDSCDNLY